MGHPLTGVDSVLFSKYDPAIYFSHTTVDQKYGPLYIHSGANMIKWAYTLNTRSFATIAGEVTQVLSAFVGPLQIQGQTAGLATNQAKTLNPGVTKGWLGQNVRTTAGGLASYSDNYTPNHELEAIVRWFVYYLEVAGSTTRGNQRRDEVAIKFVYPARQWSFYIQLTGLQGFRYDKKIISPEWSITAEIVSDNALNFFSGVTMSSFTDDLVTNYSLQGQIGLSAFANSGTELNNPAFGQTGDNGSKDPFLNPGLSPGFGDAATKMGDNFQQLLGAFAGGSFADFGFGALADNSASLTGDISQTYEKLFGSTFIGGTPGSANPQAILSGTTTYTASTSSGQDAPWIDAVLTGLSAPTSAQNIAFMDGWGRIEGGGGINPTSKATNNWLNTTWVMNQGETSINSIGVKAYPSFSIGVQATIKTLQQTYYDDIVSALQSGDPYKNPPLEGLGTWVDGPGGKDSAHAQAYAQKVMSINGTAVAGSAATGGTTDVSATVNNLGVVTYHGAMTPVRVVLHDTEGITDARGLASFFASQGLGYGCHISTSQDGTTVRLAPDNVITWHTGGANTGSLGLEMCAPSGAAATWTPANWAKYPAQYQATVTQVARWCKAYGIPVVASTDAGISTHKMQSAIHPESAGHFDPGDGFPFAQFLVDVKTAMG